MSNRTIKLAAAAVIVVGLSMAISYISTDQHSGIALGDVFEAMRQVTTITWTEVHEVKVPEGAYIDNIGHVAQCYLKAPAYRRREVTAQLKHPMTLEINDHRHINVIDENAGKSLLLDPDRMTAEFHDFAPKGGNDPLLGKFMDPEATIPQDSEDLGSSQIGGRDVVGFRLHRKGDGNDFWPGEVTEIWVDAETKRLVLLKTGDRDESHVWILKDFVFNQELDDSLFSLEPPDGYTEIAARPILQVVP